MIIVKQEQTHLACNFLVSSRMFTLQSVPKPVEGKQSQDLITCITDNIFSLNVLKGTVNQVDHIKILYLGLVIQN